MTTADSYHEALSSHRHYDGMADKSLSIVGAAMAVGPTLYATAASHFGAEFILVISAAIIYQAIQTYRRFDRYAVIALNVAAALEKGDGRFASPPLGFATVFSRIDDFKDLDASATSRTYKQLRAVGYSAATIFVVAAVALFVKRLFG